MGKILYDKCIYKNDYGYYVIPKDRVKESRHVHIKGVIIQKPTKSSHKGLNVQYKNFKRFYEPYVWEGALFKGEAGYMFVESIKDNKTVICLFFGLSKSTLNKSSISLDRLISMKLTPERKLPCCQVPDLILSGKYIWKLKKINKYHVEYTAIQEKCKATWYCLKVHVRSFKSSVYFQNGKILNIKD